MTLQAKLDAAKGNEKLDIWTDWYKDFIANNQDPWVNAIDVACEDAYEIMSPDSAMVWCFDLKKILISKLTRGNDNKLALTLLQAEKPMVDSLARANGGKHRMQAKWQFALGMYYYNSNQADEAIEALDKAMELYHGLDIYWYDWDVYMMKGTLVDW